MQPCGGSLQIVCVAVRDFSVLFCFSLLLTCCGLDMSVNSTNVKPYKFISNISVHTSSLAPKWSEVKGKD